MSLMNKVSWKVGVTQVESGYAVMADEKIVKTPMGKDIILPTAPIAEAVAMEWQDKPMKIRKETMPFTTIACVAIDLVQEKRAEVLRDIIPYADTDVICYRASDEKKLIAQQEKLLDPMVQWAKAEWGIHLMVTHGIMPVVQPAGNRDIISRMTYHYSDWQLAVLATLTKPLSSLILALAVLEKHLDAATAFRLAYLEEEFESEKWGRDMEKESRLFLAKNEITSAGKFLDML